VPAKGVAVPGFVPELNHVWRWHLRVLFPHVNIHFPVAAVEGSVVEFELEGGSVPNMIVALGHGDGVLRVGLDDPRRAVLLVTLPQHRAALGEAGTHHANLLADDTVVESQVVVGGPVVAVLSVPLAFDDEALRE